MPSKKQRQEKKQKAIKAHKKKMRIKNNYDYKSVKQIKRAMSQDKDQLQSKIDKAQLTIQTYNEEDYVYNIFYDSIIQQFEEVVNSITEYPVDAYQPVKETVEIPKLSEISLLDISSYQPINHQIINELVDKRFNLNEIDADYSVDQLIKINEGIEEIKTNYGLHSPKSQFMINYNVASQRAGEDRNALDDLYEIVDEVSNIGQMPPKALVELIHSRFKDQAAEIFDTSEKIRLFLAEKEVGALTEELTPDELEEMMKK